MADYISGYTGAQIDKSVASGSSTTGHISGSATGTGSFATIHTDSYIGVGTSVTPKILTVAGDISSSGDLYVGGDDIIIGTEPGHTISAGTANGEFLFKSGSTATTVLHISQSVGASRVGIGTTAVRSQALVVAGDISSSGDLYVEGKYKSDLTVVGDISSSGDLYVTGDFYESGSNPSKRLTLGGKSIFHGDISSSGDLYLSGNDIYESGSNPAKRITLGAKTIFHGDISSSGNLYVTGDFYESGSNPSKRLTLGGKSIFHGDISSSGDLYLKGGNIYDSGSNPAKRITLNNGSVLVHSDITASGDISSSGTLDANAVTDGLAAAIVTQIDNDEIPIAKLAEDAITIAGTSTALGGSITSAAILNNGKATVSGSFRSATDLTSSFGILSVGAEPANLMELTVAGDISASGNLYGNDVYVDDDIFIGNRLEHTGDSDTYIDFTTDQIDIVVGASNMIFLNEGGEGAQEDKVTINNDAADTDFQVKGDTEPDLIRTDAATDRVGIGVRNPSANLHISGTLQVGSGSSIGHITALGSGSFGTNNQAEVLTVEGDISASGDVTLAGGNLNFRNDSSGIPYTFNNLSSTAIGGYNLGFTIATGSTSTNAIVNISGSGGNAFVGIGTSYLSPTPSTLTVEGDISSSGATYHLKNTFADDDATPTVAGGTYWETGGNTDTITTFDNGEVGQIIHVISKAAITYDVTGTTLKCGTTDLVTADTDLTSWLFEGTNWICLGFTDQSDDLS